MNTLQHLALIMDGNGRWAQLRHRPRIHGHVRGTRVAKNIILHANKSGIKYLTLYAFSTENWYRPQDEVSFLMKLLERYLKKETDNLVKENISFQFCLADLFLNCFRNFVDITNCIKLNIFFN